MAAEVLPCNTVGWVRAIGKRKFASPRVRSCLKIITARWSHLSEAGADTGGLGRWFSKARHFVSDVRYGYAIATSLKSFQRSASGEETA